MHGRPVIDADQCAEDIGKFLDQNLAESLQRIPGVEIVRERRRGPPDFRPRPRRRSSVASA